MFEECVVFSPKNQKKRQLTSAQPEAEDGLVLPAAVSARFCCDTSNKKMAFYDCEWYSNIGWGPASGGDGFCRRNWPNDRVRLAINIGGEECSGGGKARCSLPNYSDAIVVENERLGVWRGELTRWLEDPTCADPGAVLDKRAHSITPGLAKRRTNPGEAKTEGLLLALITKVGSTAMLDAMEEIWNDGIGDKFPNLKMGHFRNYMKDLPNYNTEGPIEVCHDVMCNPHYWNPRGGSDTKTTNCEEGICTSIDSCDLDETDLAKRLAAREAKSPDGSQQITVTITLPGYYGFSGLDPDDPIMDEVVDFVSRGDCTNIRIVYLSLPNGETFNSKFTFAMCVLCLPFADARHVEHLFDGNVMGRFYGRYCSWTPAKRCRGLDGAVSTSFFRQPKQCRCFPARRRYFPARRRYRVARTTRGCSHKDINGVKTTLMRGQHPISDGRWPELATNYARPEYVLLRLRASIGMIRYLNHRGTPNINGRLAIIVNNVGLQWEHGEAMWNAAHPNDMVAIADFWREWDPRLLRPVDYAHAQLRAERH
ncbi:hypothetical protein DL762_009959 [Monosporascus cannonballus]|uniref:Uncharacterized protein n=1 Tax=Monosporascus cannonballus TaxID=155416 RepID=A0ABY0GU02_9PEZI|nr:hypothetical protein DL762_009959 [Monosporascus cannonballus]RYO91817.1 hypothetical protein DL763_004870 [Monosporascus cannonballus]